MKKFLESDWLTAVQFQGKTVPKKVIQLFALNYLFSALYDFFQVYY